MFLQTDQIKAMKIVFIIYFLYPEYFKIVMCIICDTIGENPQKFALPTHKKFKKKDKIGDIKNYSNEFIKEAITNYDSSYFLNAIAILKAFMCITLRFIKIDNY